MKIDRSNYEAFFLDYLDGNLKEELRAEFDLFLIENPDLALELNEVRDAMESLGQTHDTIASERFDFKHELKKSERVETVALIDDLLVKELEGDITLAEKEQLKRFESEGAPVGESRRVFSKTKLSAPALSFDSKGILLWPDSIDITVMPYVLVAKAQGDLNAKQLADLESYMGLHPHLRDELALYEKIKLRPEQIVFEDKASLRKKEAVVVSMRRAFYSFTSAAAAIAFIVWFSLGENTEPGRIAKSELRNPEVLNSSNTAAPADSGADEAATPFVSPQNNVYPFDQGYYEPSDDMAHINKENNPEIETVPDSQNDSELPPQQSPVDMMNEIMEQENNDVAQHVVPDMTPIHVDNRSSQPGDVIKPRTILSLLGERVEKSVESSYAYGLVERNAEKIGSASKNAEGKIVYERISKDAQTDQVKFRFMGIGFERDVAKKQPSGKNSESRFSRLERKYRSLISN